MLVLFMKSLHRKYPAAAKQQHISRGQWEVVYRTIGIPLLSIHPQPSGMVINLSHTNILLRDWCSHEALPFLYYPESGIHRHKHVIVDTGWQLCQVERQDMFAHHCWLHCPFPRSVAAGEGSSHPELLL